MQARSKVQNRILRIRSSATTQVTRIAFIAPKVPVKVSGGMGPYCRGVMERRRGRHLVEPALVVFFPRYLPRRYGRSSTAPTRRRKTTKVIWTLLGAKLENAPSWSIVHQPRPLLVGLFPTRL